MQPVFKKWRDLTTIAGQSPAINGTVHHGRQAVGAGVALQKGGVADGAPALGKKDTLPKGSQTGVGYLEINGDAMVAGGRSSTSPMT